jgi:hypothetical protein
MRTLLTLLLLVAIVTVVGFYARFVFSRLGRPEGMRGNTTWPWPRGRRLVLFILSWVVTLFVLLPAAIFLLGAPFGMSICPADATATGPWRCSPLGRLTTALLVLVVLLPLAALWQRLLLLTFVRPRT